MSPLTTSIVYKMQKPTMSLKQFMMRTEILNLYRAFLRLGRFLEEPQPLKQDIKRAATFSDAVSKSNGTKVESAEREKFTENQSKNNPMKVEWTQWVRSEFRIRQTAAATDEEMTRALLVYGKRQLQEMERTMMLATNRNMPPERVSIHKSKSKDKANSINNPQTTAN